jgi:hypothetical protein
MWKLLKISGAQTLGTGWGGNLQDFDGFDWISQPELKMERETGIEPATSSLGSWRSTAELLPLTGVNGI